MNRFLPFAAALLLGTGAAFAAVTADSVAADLTAQGYTHVVVKDGSSQIKVEAVRNGQKLEVIYDKATGAVLKTETRQVGLFDSTKPGVTIKHRDGDFVKVGAAASASSGSSGSSAKSGEKEDEHESEAATTHESEDHDGASGSSESGGEDHGGSEHDGSSGGNSGGHDGSGESEHEGSGGSGY